MPELMRDRVRTAGPVVPPHVRSPMKHEAAEQVLNDVLLKYGAAACDTPHMLETLLRKHGRGCPQEVDVLSTGLRCGVVGHLRSEKGVDPASLARLLLLDTHVPPGQAEWVVSTWAAAIALAPSRVSTLSAPAAADQSAGGSMIRSAGVLVLAAATGAIAYLAFAH
jgi:hypothetical protein